MDKEIWKPVVGYEGLYEVSTLGRVKRLARMIVDSMGRNVWYREKILFNRISKSTGYPCVNLSKNGKVSSINVHKLIADAFIPNPDSLPCINHIDENRSNSVLSNLERCTYAHNNNYGTIKRKRLATRRKNLEGLHKTIYQYSKDGELIAEYHCGVQQLEEKLGYCLSTCLAGNSKTAHGYVFSYDKTFSYKEDLPKKHQKLVIQVDKDGNEIRKFKSKSEVERVLGFDRHLLNGNGLVVIKGLKFIIEKK